MSEKKPNILFLLCDQHRFDSVSVNDSYLCKTPAIDSIAKKGVRFTKAYTPIALCSPARGSLITGLYPHNHGQLANMGNFNSVFDQQILNKPNYIRLLKNEGYSVSYVGKWHLPKEGDKDFWGFDNWYTSKDWIEYLKKEGIDFVYGKDEVQRLEWGTNPPFCGRSVLPGDKKSEKITADKVMEYIEQNKNSEKPFMICAGFFGPHFPYAVPEPYNTMYNPNEIKRWGNFDESFDNKPNIQQKEMLRWNTSQLTWPDWQKVIAHYWGYCTFIDDQIKRILDYIEEIGISEETIVIYTTDHGDMLGSHRLFNKGFNAYEEDNHIPFIVKWPGVTKEDSVCTEYISLVDLMPTLLQMGEAPIPDDLDGRDLTPLLSNKIPEDWNDSILVEFHGYESTLASIRMVRDDRWKYVYNPFDRDELYDMQSDPYELRNLADQLGFKHVLRRMKQKLLKWLRSTNDGIVGETSWQSNSYDLFISKREE